MRDRIRALEDSVFDTAGGGIGPPEELVGLTLAIIFLPVLMYEVEDLLIRG